MLDSLAIGPDGLCYVVETHTGNLNVTISLGHFLHAARQAFLYQMTASFVLGQPSAGEEDLMYILAHYKGSKSS